MTTADELDDWQVQNALMTAAAEFIRAAYGVRELVTWLTPEQLWDWMERDEYGDAELRDDLRLALDTFGDLPQLILGHVTANGVYEGPHFDEMRAAHRLFLSVARRLNAVKVS